MTKNYLLSSIAVLAFASAVYGQEAPNYYSTANGLTGYALKTELGKIISNGAKDFGYGGLYDTYATSDIDHYYEKDGSVLDIYSENPAGKDPYNFIPGEKKCGNYSKEGDCYNREHIVPQSLFDKKSPMVSDAHFIVPTDGKVNGMRSNYPFGIVKTPSFTSDNGTKVGTSGSNGYGGTVAEPIDEFKGDVARMILYFVTRYESKRASFSSGNILENNADGLTSWEKEVLLKWHYQDPVSQKEIDRNNAVFARQQNRNPYIDHPEWTRTIWGNPGTDEQAPTQPQSVVASYPSDGVIALTWSPSTDNTAVKGYNIYVNGRRVATSLTPSVELSKLSTNTNYTINVQAFDEALNLSEKSVDLVVGSVSDDSEAPTAPTNIKSDFIGSNLVKLSWTASTDNVRVAGYEVYVDDVKVLTTESNIEVALFNLSPNTSYRAKVRAFDAAKNYSDFSSDFLFTTLAPDTEAPTVPTNLSYKNVTTTTADISWDASSDNIVVEGYKVLVNGEEDSQVSTNSITLDDLAPNTKYTVEVQAYDAAGNLSVKSNSIEFTTAQTQASDSKEDFEDMTSSTGINDSQYGTRTWTNSRNTISWTATDARIDGSITNGKAVIIRVGDLTSSTISGGITSLSLSTMQAYGSTPGKLKAYVNDVYVGDFDFGAQGVKNENQKISGLNVKGDFTIKIENNNGSKARVAIDDLSWTSNTLGVDEIQYSNKSYTIYPNPVKNQILNVKGEGLQKISEAFIYSVSGQLVQTIAQPFKSSNTIVLRNLPKRMYILKTNLFTEKFIVQ
ncbi:endonuclease [Elizabethkingia sp. JS20170427COW]|uniref:endonuclease n=1 Tax=Elizabethkingia sp. JS20170427COW TaxID=2583851 RepID=UPI0011107FDD|nr:endonuclease [Elizabethkingia sp. JS20170427COW]QCX53691.1 T9SS type A sorting domain-containing protein [Elizabethkingia sp. JS20170427COW]